VPTNIDTEQPVSAAVNAGTEQPASTTKHHKTLPGTTATNNPNCQTASTTANTGDQRHPCGVIATCTAQAFNPREPQD